MALPNWIDFFWAVIRWVGCSCNPLLSIEVKCELSLSKCHHSVTQILLSPLNIYTAPICSSSITSNGAATAKSSQPSPSRSPGPVTTQPKLLPRVFGPVNIRYKSVKVIKGDVCAYYLGYKIIASNPRAIQLSARFGLFEVINAANIRQGTDSRFGKATPQWRRDNDIVQAISVKVGDNNLMAK